MIDEPDARNARDHLRSHREGVLIADGLAEKIRFVIDSATGRIVFPTTPATAEAMELVLFIPEEEPRDSEELQLLLTPSPIDPDRDPACDRWHAYHGDARLTRWLACTVESARFAGDVIEGDVLNEANPLAASESALCRLLNADRPRLAAICSAQAGVLPREPCAVGVDDTGIDVRARFGIVRIAFPRPVSSRTEAEEIIQTMLEQARP